MEGFGVKLSGTDTACRDLRPVKAQYADHRQSEVLGGSRNLPQIGGRQGCHRVRQPVACIPQDRAAQTVVEHPGQQVFRGQLWHGAKPPAEQLLDFRCGKLGQQIDMKCQRPFFRGGGPGQLEHGGAADTEVGKLNFTPAGRHGVPVPTEPEVSIGPDALQSLDKGVVRLDLHQCGIQLGDAVAQGLQQLIAAAGPAQLTAGHAAAADDDPVRREGFLGGEDGEPLFCFLQARHLEPGAGRDPGGVGGEAQHVHHAACLIGVGIDPAIVLRRGQQAQTVKEIQRGIQTQRFKGGADESGVLPVIVGKAHVQVGEVAAAVAGG